MPTPRRKRKISKRVRKAVKVLNKLQKAGLVQTSGYSLELPFSKRLSASGTVDYASNIDMV